MHLAALAAKRCRWTYARVVRQADRLEGLASGPDESLNARVDAVSAWSVAQHLDHLAGANQAMAGAIRKILGSEHLDSQRRPTLIGHVVLITGWIPRGAGKAPAYILPASVSVDGVRQNLNAARGAIEELDGSLPEIGESGGRLDHFAFGGLTPLQWLRTMGVHTHHHMKIIRDIQRQVR
jgi:hypothetical protein